MTTTPTARPHVVHVGFYEAFQGAVDFDASDVTVLLHREAVDHLSPAIRNRFAEVGVLDVPHSLDLDDYDRGYPQMVELVEGFSRRLGPPSAVVGIFEHATVPAARLRAHFDVPGTELAVAEAFRDKSLMKRRLSGSGVGVPRFWEVEGSMSAAEVGEMVTGLPGKVVLKPRSQAASFGISIFDSVAELVAHLRQVGVPDNYEVEEFIEGAILHCDGVVRDGTLRLLNVSRYLDNCFDFQHRDVPLASLSVDDPSLVVRARACCETILSHLGLRDSSFHLELFLGVDGDLTFLEVGNRFGGAGVSGQLRLAHGIDVVRESVSACTLSPSDLPEGLTLLNERPGSSGWLYMPMREKRRCTVRGIAGLEHMPASVKLGEIPNIGEELNTDLGVFMASGRFYLVGDSELSVERDMRTIMQVFEIDVALAEEEAHE